MLQGGSELCRIEGFDCGKDVAELKVSIEAKAGIVSALTRLINPESQVELQDHLTLEDMGMPSKQALTAGVIQLCTQKLKKVVVADELQIEPEEVTDSKLAALCDSIRDDPTDIMVLCGSQLITDISCLAQLSTISHLDISSCDLGAQGGFHLAGVIKDMSAISSLNLANNNIGQLVLPEGWRAEDDDGEAPWIHTDGQRVEDGMPGGSTPVGVIALANIIPNMGALSSANLLGNQIPVEQAYELVAIMQSKEKLTTLCGFSREEVTLDVSNQGLGPGDAVLIANDISDMGALTSLDLSSNELEAGGAKIVAKAIKVSDYAIAVVSVPFSCPSEPG
jgi:hypothetical protein